MIVITTLEALPDYCYDCPCHSGYCKADNEHRYSDYRPYWCPLKDTNKVELLKEQEAVEPRRDADCPTMFRCGVCGEYVGFVDSDPGDPNEQDNYCRNCGRRVKWDGFDRKTLV